MASGSSRLIHLRRPVVLSVVDEPFVPHVAPHALDDVDRRWASMCAENPAYHDGSLYHVFGVHRNGHGGAILHVAECSYRFHAVQDDGFDLGVRSLGVKGITIRDGRVLLGRRSTRVDGYRGLWEFAPGGVLEPPNPAVDAIRAELAEETGVRPAREPTPVAVIFDDVMRTWEIVFRIQAGPSGDDGPPSTAEYDELLWRGVDELPEGLSPIARRMVGLVARTLAPPG